MTEISVTGPAAVNGTVAAISLPHNITLPCNLSGTVTIENVPSVYEMAESAAVKASGAPRRTILSSRPRRVDIARPPGGRSAAKRAVRRE
jgi:hypothetical protein